ncbi:transposase [Thalassotalea atypica]|uniref:transposase n=1 Tax=Thalassotalea atypica TaxID=2054316 RepID=UPI0033059D72
MYTKAFKEEAVALVIEQVFSVPEVAMSVGGRAFLFYCWKFNKQGLFYHSIHHGMKKGIEAYIRYHNQIRLDTSNKNCPPIEFE